MGSFFRSSRNLLIAPTPTRESICTSDWMAQWSFSTNKNKSPPSTPKKRTSLAHNELDRCRQRARLRRYRYAQATGLADPLQAYLLIQQLAQAGIKVEEFPQTVGTTKMGETLFSLVRDKNLIAYPSDELREHLLNAVGLETPSGVRMAKGKSTKKMEAAIAFAMAAVSAARGCRGLIPAPSRCLARERYQAIRWHNSDQPSSEGSQINRMWDTDLEGQRAVPKELRVIASRSSDAAATTRFR